MGYTHYLKSAKAPASPEKAKEIQAEVSKVLKRYKGVLQFDYGISNEIEIDRNGMPQNLIRFNGIEEDGHETFYLSSGFKGFNFCKTAGKPYDAAVCECLLIFKHLLDADISSDGFSSYQPEGKKYKIGNTVKAKDVDGKWVDAVKNINEQLGVKYKFVVDNMYGDGGKYFSYKLKLK